MQLADYVASLASQAALRNECWVEADEKRSFEEVMRLLSLHILSGLEGG